MYVDATKIDQEWCFEFKNLTVSQVRLIRKSLRDVVGAEKELADIMAKRIEQSLIK